MNSGIITRYLYPYIPAQCHPWSLKMSLDFLVPTVMELFDIKYTEHFCVRLEVCMRLEIYMT